LLLQVRAFERRFLELLQYQAVVTQGLYARYYFELRDLFEHLMAQRGSEGAAGGTDPRTAGSASSNGSSTVNFPLQPLSLWRAKQLELYSDSFHLQPTHWDNGSANGSGGGAQQGDDAMRTSPLADGASPRVLNAARTTWTPAQTLEDVTYTPRGRYVQS
jgi:hypothetical protein